MVKLTRSRKNKKGGWMPDITKMHNDHFKMHNDHFKMHNGSHNYQKNGYQCKTICTKSNRHDKKSRRRSSSNSYNEK